MNAALIRRGLRDWRTLGVALLAAAITANSAPAAPVSTAAGTVSYSMQGGCNEYTVGSTGFEIGVCINDRGTGTTAYPDIYVNQIGAHTGPCSIRIELWDDNGHALGNAANAPCAYGHHSGNAYGPVGHSVVVHAFARLQTNGASYYFGGGHGDSPSILLSEQQFFCNYDYPLTAGPAVTPQTTLTMAARNFNRYFPVSSSCSSLSAGETCYLAGSNPILVVALSPTSFTFQSLPGHFEGAGRTITFSFLRDSGQLFLNVSSHGPITWGSVFTTATAGAHVLWQNYATKLSYGLVSGAAG